MSWIKEKSNALGDAATEHSKCVFIFCVHEDKRGSNGTQKICFHLLCS